MKEEEEEGNNNIESKNNGETNIKKKNRTLQFYKFLFYSIKTELKLHDFVKLFRACNSGEICLWLMSLIIYASTPKDLVQLPNGGKSRAYKGSFIWFHIIHVFRAVLGIYFIHSFPRSFEVINSLESYSDSKLEKTLFNDLMRETIFFNVTEKIKPKKKFVLIYLIMTIINLAFDGIDFLVVLFLISNARANAKVVLLTYLLINVLYIIIDCAYVLWLEQLKYVFPKEYLRPVETILMGIVDNALIKFKLKKEKTNIISEANAQKSGQPYVKSSNEMKNGGVNVLESILKDSFGANVEGIDNYNNNENNKDGSREIYPNNKPPQSEDIKINEIKLDD
jgi:hypothetical protein